MIIAGQVATKHQGRSEDGPQAHEGDLLVPDKTGAPVGSGGYATVLSQEDAAAPLSLPTLYVAGDSTASNGAENGWGSHFQKYFDPATLTVVNRARGGRSSRTIHRPESIDL